MPSSWTKKDERQYKAIKKSSRERGVSNERAEEIAARTVNKQRRQRGDTSQKTTQGTGNPNNSLDGRRKDELYNIARQMDIEGRSKMTKKQLVEAIRRRR